MTRTAVLVAACLAAGCSTRSPADGGPGTDGGTTDLATSDGAATDATPHDGATPDGAHADAAPGVDASTDASVRASSPPAGYTRCGAGTFTGTDARTACGNAPTIGALPYASACGSATCTGGRWEIWCPPASSTTLYFWSELDGVTTPGMTCAVMVDGGTLPLTIYGELGGGRYEGHSGAGGGSGDLTSSGGTFLDSVPVTVVVEGQVGLGTIGATGTLQVWVQMTPDSCPGTTGGAAPVYVFGIAATWGGADV